MVVIIGGGIIGLSIAFELASRGATVRVYDRDEPAKAASWAAAGMLAPFTEHMHDAPMQALCRRSLEWYPQFVQAVREASSVDPHLRRDGILSVAYTPDQLEALKSRCQELRACETEARLLDREQTLSLEPALGKHLSGSLLVEGEGQIDNRRLGRALSAACRARGVVVHTGMGSLAVECDARRVLGIRTEMGFVAAETVVNAAGAWAAQISGVPGDCVPEVRPVKGQMLALQIPVGLMRHTTWVPGAYLVPRPDGRLLVGATVEESGYDVRVTAAGLGSLLHAVIQAAPALGDFTVTETWAGLRPGSPDGRPFIGPTALGGYYLATGHYRNGIMLAPATARLLSDAILGNESAPLEAFSPQRCILSA